MHFVFINVFKSPDPLIFFFKNLVLVGAGKMCNLSKGYFCSLVVNGWFQRKTDFILNYILTTYFYEVKIIKASQSDLYSFQH